MAWRFVVQPNGLLARFSTIVDDFTDYNMTTYEAEQVAIYDYNCGQRTALEKIQNAKNNPNRWAEALQIIEDIHGKQALPVWANEEKLP